MDDLGKFRIGISQNCAHIPNPYVNLFYIYYMFSSFHVTYVPLPVLQGHFLNVGGSFTAIFSVIYGVSFFEPAENKGVVFIIPYKLVD